MGWGELDWASATAVRPLGHKHDATAETNATADEAVDRIGDLRRCLRRRRFPKPIPVIVVLRNGER